MKQYTIKDAAKFLNVPTSTIRFYDRQGLLPFMERSESNYRLFTEGDLAMLRSIDCLKRTGMPIKDIRQFAQWVQEGDSSLTKRYEMFVERRQAVENQIAELQKTLALVESKCRYYAEAVEAGTDAIHFTGEPSWQDGEFPCEKA